MLVKKCHAVWWIEWCTTSGIIASIGYGVNEHNPSGDQKIYSSCHRPGLLEKNLAQVDLLHWAGLSQTIRSTNAIDCEVSQTQQHSQFVTSVVAFCVVQAIYSLYSALRSSSELDTTTTTTRNEILTYRKRVSRRRTKEKASLGTVSMVSTYRDRAAARPPAARKARAPVTDTGRKTALRSRRGIYMMPRCSAGVSVDRRGTRGSAYRGNARTRCDGACAARLQTIPLCFALASVVYCFVSELLSSGVAAAATTDLYWFRWFLVAALRQGHVGGGAWPARLDANFARRRTSAVRAAP